MNETQPSDDLRPLIESLATTPGPTGDEGPRMDALRLWLADAGVDTRSDAAGNLWVDIAPDAAWDQCVVFDAHVDVVGAGVAEHVIEDHGRLIGAGVADNLAAVAMLAVFAREATAGRIVPARPVKIVFTVGEEGLGNLRGVRQVVDDHETGPLLFVSLDGSYHKCHIAGLGSNRYRIIVQCPGGHSWGAYGAPSATERLVDMMAAIKRAHAELAGQTDEKISYNIGSLAGGEGINCIARQAEATFEFRSADPTPLSRMDRAAHTLAAEAAGDENTRIELQTIGRRPAAKPFGNHAAEILLRQIWAAHELLLATTVASTNINIPLARGWPAICAGVCIGGNGHREDEYVSIASLTTGWSLLTDLMERLGEL